MCDDERLIRSIKIYLTDSPVISFIQRPVQEPCYALDFDWKEVGAAEIKQDD